MSLFTRSFVVALVAAAVIFVGLVVFSRVVVPALDGSNEGDGITYAPSPVSPTATPIIASIPAPLLSQGVPSQPLPESAVSFHDMENARALEQRNARAADIIVSLDWIADGISDEEHDAVEALIYLAATSENVFQSLANKTWLNSHDSRNERTLIVDLEYIAYKDEKAAEQLLEMDFLDTLQPPDVLAVKSLARMADLNIHFFQRTLRHPAIIDGITDEEARIVTLLDGEYEAGISLTNILLNPTLTTVEERSIDLPLAGEVTLAVIRTNPGADRSMDLFEKAVRNAEGLMGQPFPATYLPLLFALAVPDAFTGSHNGTHIVILPEYDVDDGSYEALQAESVIAHEVAHYYWRWSQPWLDEGAAEFTTAYLKHLSSGYPPEPVNYPCGHTQTIRRLEARSFHASDMAGVCDYAVGERFFLDLYQRLGAEAFWSGFRILYRDIDRIVAPNVKPPGIDHVRRAFAEVGEAGAPATQQAVEEVIDRWYEGRTLVETGVPDGRPVVADLPEVAGWVNRAYVSLEEAGGPVKTFASRDVGDWVWLTLEYSHDYFGPPTELAFEVVEYFEDGFPYSRYAFTIEVDRNHSGGTQWLSIGPGPGQAWAVGRHWVVVNHQGRKVAQVEFEVKH